MTGDHSFFTQQGKYFSPHTIKKNAIIAFKDHTQFPLLVDILARKDIHHIILNTDFSSTLYVPFLEGFLHHLSNDTIPQPLHNAELIYLDIENLVLSSTKQNTIETDFQCFRDTLSNDKYLLIVLTKMELLTDDKFSKFIQNQLETLLHHPTCRFLVFTTHKDAHKDDELNHFLAHSFDRVNLNRLTEWDVMTLLKLKRTELEMFHHILIPEELLLHAYLLAERYLSTGDILEKTGLLLDSSSARTGAVERTDHNNQFKPVLSMNILTSVLSRWTQIPVTHLQFGKFKFNEFTQGLQQSVFGQDAALTLLGHQLQQTQAHLQQKTGPFCSFLFAGPAHSGKKTTAIALAEQLFNQLNVLYFVPTAAFTLSSFAEINVERCVDKQYLTLKEAIRQTPYAIILFEKIDQALPVVQEGLEEILRTGYLRDDHGHQYNFRQSIILVTTTRGTERLAEIAKSFALEEEKEEVNLMELILSEKKRAEVILSRHFSPREIADEIMREMTTHVKASLCQHLHMVPFLPLTKAAIEKIIRLKLTIVGKQLDTRYGIELGYAPEVIRYLANEALMKQKANHHVVDIDNELKPLYFTVEQAILSQADNKNRPNQLFLQLNETGQLLRCDWLMMATARHHAP
jgi:ATP-dependent Clp protease ATP-binding subunit ClpA